MSDYGDNIKNDDEHDDGDDNDCADYNSWLRNFKPH